MLVRGGDSKFVRDEDAAEFLHCQPGLRTETVADSGHAVQSDQRLALTHLIQDFVFG
jgi:esterase